MRLYNLMFCCMCNTELQGVRRWILTDFFFFLGLSSKNSTTLFFFFSSFPLPSFPPSFLPFLSPSLHFSFLPFFCPSFLPSPPSSLFLLQDQNQIQIQIQFPAGRVIPGILSKLGLQMTLRSIFLIQENQVDFSTNWVFEVYLYSSWPRLFPRNFGVIGMLECWAILWHSHMNS